MVKIKVGDLALCSKGSIGLITEAKRKQLPWGKAYVGIHLTNQIAKIGSPWSSRHPKLIGHIKPLDVSLIVPENWKWELNVQNEKLYKSSSSL